MKLGSRRSERQGRVRATVLHHNTPDNHIRSMSAPLSGSLLPLDKRAVWGDIEFAVQVFSFAYTSSKTFTLLLHPPHILE